MKAVLSYSGGLDTTVAVRLLQEKHGAEVITVLVDVGQPREEIADAEKRADMLGVSKHYTIDARVEFVDDFVFPAIKANLQHDACYLTPALARPLIGLKTVETAKKEGADTVVHGVTDRCHNDQFVFGCVFQDRAPELGVLTPLMDMPREKVAEYARQHELPLPSGYERSKYAVDTNVYGRAVCGGPLENFDTEPDEDVYELTNSPEDAPDEAAVIRIDFESGCPTRLDGKEMSGLEIIESLSKIAGEHGIGRGDVIHEHISGIRSRSIIEAPAPAVLFPAHRELESIVLTGEEMEFKQEVEKKLAHFVHDGLWSNRLKDALFAFVDKTQESVSGSVEVKLYKGTVRTSSKSSSHILPKVIHTPYSISQKTN